MFLFLRASESLKRGTKSLQRGVWAVQRFPASVSTQSFAEASVSAGGDSHDALQEMELRCAWSGRQQDVRVKSESQVGLDSGSS